MIFIIYWGEYIYSVSFSKGDEQFAISYPK
ncbi:MAG: hypothetical protein PWP31_1123 [Clostridia bacterium]|nr:hypothetical protein [Clostridia bacterium]